MVGEEMSQLSKPLGSGLGATEDGGWSGSGEPRPAGGCVNAPEDRGLSCVGMMSMSTMVGSPIKETLKVFTRKSKTLLV